MAYAALFETDFMTGSLIDWDRAGPAVLDGARGQGGRWARSENPVCDVDDDLDDDEAYFLDDDDEEDDDFSDDYDDDEFEEEEFDTESEEEYDDDDL